jgi:predicted PurR-regulated permease PerM
MDRRIKFDISLKSVATVAVALMIFALLYYVKDILVLFLISFVIATALEPAVDWLQKKHVPRVLTIILIYLLVGTFIYTLIRLLVPPITTQVNTLIDNRQVIYDRLSTTFSHLPVSIKSNVQDFVNTLPERAGNIFSGSFVSNVFGVFAGVLGVITVLVASFYLLIEKNVTENAIKTFWPTKSEDRALAAYKKIVEKISLWARGQLILSTSVGVLTFIGLSILKFEYALILAIVAAFLDFIPMVGPSITMVIGVGLALAYSPLYALWVALLFLGIQQFEANVLVPQIMRRAVGISPILIIFAILVGSKLLGLIGIIIAVPVASAIVVIIEAINKKELK